ncbi:MAG: hypothetical protein PHW73_13600 [Atribacterota bacterium]|nr:hypothetical protein [Atribacterota bacterium]
MNAIILHADLKKYSSLANRTLDLVFNTSELTAEGIGIILSYLHVTGTLAFKIGDYTNEEVDNLPEYKPEFSNFKTPSERLRAVLFVKYKQAEVQEEFEIWRIREMERIIDSVKAELRPE